MLIWYGSRFVTFLLLLYYVVILLLVLLVIIIIAIADVVVAVDVVVNIVVVAGAVVSLPCILHSYTPALECRESKKALMAYQINEIEINLAAQVCACCM